MGMRFVPRRLADSPGDAPRQRQQQGHGVVGEVVPDVALLTGQEDIALDKGREKRAVYPRAGLLHPLDVRRELQ